MKATVVLALLAAAVVAADTPELAKKEKQKLQGTWVVESAAVKGESDELYKGKKLVFSGDTVIWPVNDEEQKATWAIDPTKSPKHMDLTIQAKNGKTVFQSIYHLEGDTLKICSFSASRELGGKPTKEDVVTRRPEKFESSQAWIIVLKREKK